MNRVVVGMILGLCITGKVTSGPISNETLEQVLCIADAVSVPRSIALELMLEESGDRVKRVLGDPGVESRVKAHGYPSVGLYQLHTKPSNLNYLLEKYWNAPKDKFDIKNPLDNAIVGLSYLSDLHERYDSWYKALCYYNHGNLDTTPVSTKAYARRIVNATGRLKMIEESGKFVGFPKISRWSREVIVTEKIDGTNAQIYITNEGEIKVGKRTSWISVEKDNFGFASWVEQNKEELIKLGPGHHFGEWWGSGIQRRYGLVNGDKRFSLFNVSRWGDYGKEMPPKGVSVVPLLWAGNADQLNVDKIMRVLAEHGSFATNFSKPEGIVLYFPVAQVMFKKTFESDGEKGKW